PSPASVLEDPVAEAIAEDFDEYWGPPSNVTATTSHVGHVASSRNHVSHVASGGGGSQSSEVSRKPSQQGHALVGIRRPEPPRRSIAGETVSSSAAAAASAAQAAHAAVSSTKRTTTKTTNNNNNNNSIEKTNNNNNNSINNNNNNTAAPTAQAKTLSHSLAAETKSTPAHATQTSTARTSKNNSCNNSNDNNNNNHNNHNNNKNINNNNNNNDNNVDSPTAAAAQHPSRAMLHEIKAPPASHTLSSTSTTKDMFPGSWSPSNASTRLVLRDVMNRGQQRLSSEQCGMLLSRWAGNPALLDSRGFFHGRPATNVQGSGAAASRPWCPASQASAASSGTGPSAADSFGASAYAGASSSAAPGSSFRTLGPSRSLHGSRREGASGSLSGTGRRTGSSALLMAGASASVSRHRGPGGLGAPTSPSFVCASGGSCPRSDDGRRLKPGGPSG
ncbi:unnamed protein product, partial [Polarella glacialis]